MRTLISLSTLLFCCALASAQFELPVIRPHFVVFSMPKVKEHLKVTDSQSSKIKEVLDPIMHDDGEGHTFMSINGSEDMEKIDKDVMKVLDDKQNERLEQLWLQQSGLLALTDKKVAEKLSLKTEQSKQIDEIATDYRQKMRDLFMSDDGNGELTIKIDPSKLADLQKATDKKIGALLTDDQNAAWKKLLGEKFEFSDKDK